MGPTLAVVVPGEPWGLSRQRFAARVMGTVNGRPVARAFPVGDPKKAAQKAHLLRFLLPLAPPMPLDEPVIVTMRAIFECPKGERRVRTPARRRWHVVTPDVDNLLKALLDAAVEARWIRDDGCVAKSVIEKIVGAQGEAPAVHFTLRPLEPFDA